MKIQIINPGPLTSVQDAGRFGYMEYGITSSGVMDMDAYHIVNAFLWSYLLRTSVGMCSRHCLLKLL